MIGLRRVLAILGCSSAVFMASCSSPNTEPSVSVSDITLEEEASEAPAASSPVPSPTPTVAPTRTPSPAPDPEDVLDILQEVDILDYMPVDIFERAEGQRWYEPVLRNQEAVLNLSDYYAQWQADVQDKADELGLSSISFVSEPPSWQLLAAILSNYQGDEEGMRTALIEAAAFDCVVEEMAPGKYEAFIHSEEETPSSLFYGLPQSDVATPFGLLTSYAYLSTIYDNELQIRKEIPAPILEEFLFPIANPEKVYVSDCWALPRDGGARYHTGTDMNAPEWTDLYAVVDGVILDNGTNPVAGNYIVLEGKDGTQYHYYHLVEPSKVLPGTAVSRGEVIANVGNTGNSTANHLHFTIITDDGYFVNPYTYLAESQKQTISANTADTE